MKCLHVLPMNKLSGAEKMVLILCKNMKKYDPIVVCGGENLRDIFEKNNIKSYSLSFSTKDMFKTLKGLKNIVKQNNIKIIHAHDNLASFNAYLVKKLYGLDLKIISHIHNCYPWLTGNNSYKKIDSFFRRKYDYNIACGRVVYDYYKNNADYFETKKTTILSNAMDIDEITNIKITKSEEVIKKYNVPNGKTILGFIGRLSKQKGIIPFIKEFANYKEDFLDCSILLVGNGEQEKDVKILIKELELEEFFILTGFQKDVYNFYPIIDIFFLPSLYEGLPMVVLEAMAFKKPVVAMEVGSLSEVIVDGYNGCLVKKGDYKEFIISMCALKKKIKLREAYGNNAYNYIKENFNIKEYDDNLTKVYDGLMTNN